MGWWDDLTGASAADASRRAAQDQYGKEQGVINQLRGDASAYADAMRQASGMYDPYRNAGTGALGSLMGYLGLGGDQNAFVNAYRNLPGYQAGMDAGNKSVAAGANALGMGRSGRALKALSRFGSDYESQRAGEHFGRLSGLAGQGLAATGAAAGMVGQGLTGQLGAQTTGAGYGMQSAKTIGQGDIAAEQARMQGLQGLLNTGAYLGGSLLGGFKPSGGWSSMLPNWNIGMPGGKGWG